VSSGSIEARLRLGTDSRLEIEGSGTEPLVVEVCGTGAMLRWFTDHFADSDQSIAVVEGTTVFDIMDGKASGLPPGCEGLVCLIPGQSEEGAAGAGRGEPGGPGGGLIGITVHHGRYHVYRAILEGAAFALRSGMERCGVQFEDLDAIEAEGAGDAGKRFSVVAQEIRRLVKNNAKQGTTVLLSSHNMLEVEFLCDRIALISEGIIIEEGTPKALMDKHNAKNVEEVFTKVVR